MDEYGLIPQNILRQAIAELFEKITEGQQQGSVTDEVNEPRENSCEDNYSEPVVLVNQSQTVEDK